MISRIYSGHHAWRREKIRRAALLHGAALCKEEGTVEEDTIVVLAAGAVAQVWGLRMCII